MADALLTWIRANGWLGVALFLAIENVGVPWPTTLAYIVAIELVRLGEMSWLGALVVCTAGHVAGSLAAYALGRGGDSAIMRRARCHDGLTRTLDWLHTWFARHGTLTILFARLVGYVRPWASLAAGLGEVPLGAFALWTTVGTAVHVAIALWMSEVGFWFWDEYPALRVWLIVGVALLFWGAFLYAVIRGACARLAARRGGRPECADAGPSETAETTDTPAPVETPPMR